MGELLLPLATFVLKPVHKAESSEPLPNVTLPEEESIDLCDRPLGFVNLCYRITIQQWVISRYWRAGGAFCCVDALALAQVFLCDIILPEVIQTRE